MPTSSEGGNPVDDEARILAQKAPGAEFPGVCPLSHQSVPDLHSEQTRQCQRAVDVPGNLHGDRRSILPTTEFHIRVFRPCFMSYTRDLRQVA